MQSTVFVRKWRCTSHFQATDGSGKLLVVGQFIEVGAENAALAPSFLRCRQQRLLRTDAGRLRPWRTVAERLVELSLYRLTDYLALHRGRKLEPAVKPDDDVA